MASDRTAREIRRLREQVRVLGIVNVILCFLLLVALFMLFSGRSPRTVTAIEVDGKVVAYVRSAAEAKRLLEDVRKEKNSGMMQDGRFDPNQPIVVKPVPADGVILSDRNEAKAKLLNAVRVLNKGYAITVDGEPVVTMATEDYAKQVLTRVNAKYLESGEGKVVEQKFKENVVIQPVDAPSAEIQTDIAGAAEKLTKPRGTIKSYTVVAGDTPEKIARKNGIRTQDLFALNPGLKERQRSIRVGEKLKVSTPKAGVTVITVREIQRKADVDPGPPEERMTPNLPRGRRNVARRAKKGTELQTVQITYENDRPLPNERIVNRTVIEPAVREIVMVGTGPP
jgi:LysM repeat protein